MHVLGTFISILAFAHPPLAQMGYLTARVSTTIMSQNPVLTHMKGIRPMSLPQILSTQTESPSSIDEIAQQIQQRGMGNLAAVLLHTFKPLAWVGGQMVW